MSSPAQPPPCNSTAVGARAIIVRSSIEMIALEQAREVVLIALFYFSDPSESCLFRGKKFRAGESENESQSCDFG